MVMPSRCRGYLKSFVITTESIQVGNRMMSTELSPAAQATWDAWQKAPVSLDIQQSDRDALAAALRAVAELLSKEVDAPKVDGSKYNGLWHSFDYLNAIAAELEGN